MQNLMKICQYVEVLALLKQTVSTFFFVDSCFGLILLFIILTSLFRCALVKGILLVRVHKAYIVGQSP